VYEWLGFADFYTFPYEWLYMSRLTRLTCRRVRLVGVYEWLGFADFYTFPHIVLGVYEWLYMSRLTRLTCRRV
jgi:hypothetical protein